MMAQEGAQHEKGSARTTMMPEPMWKVVAILDEYRIVINARKGDLEIGDEVEVFQRRLRIVDPESGEDLGEITYPKAKLHVIQVHERMAIAESAMFERGKAPPGSLVATVERIYGAQ